MTRKITQSFLLKYNQEIESAHAAGHRYSIKDPRAQIADLARKELGYADGTITRDIWHSVWNAYRRLKERD